MDLGDTSDGAGGDHGGAGGCIGGCESSREVSGAGASARSSDLGSGFVSEGSGAASSTFSISTSTVGGGVGSLAGVSSLCLVSGADSVERSMAEGSSSGGDGGRGEGLFEETSFRIGDFASVLTDVDRIRSRCSLSS